MARDLGLDEVVDHFTLNGEETGWLRNKAGATRPGFAVQMKFLLWRGRFPKMRLELPRDAVKHVARQMGVDTGELAAYDFTSRTAQRHRTELRQLTGRHECTRTGMVKLTSWLVDEIWHVERREELIRAELLRQMRTDLIEPPTADQPQVTSVTGGRVWSPAGDPSLSPAPPDRVRLVCPFPGHRRGYPHLCLFCWAPRAGGAVLCSVRPDRALPSYGRHSGREPR